MNQSDIRGLSLRTEPTSYSRSSQPTISPPSFYQHTSLFFLRFRTGFAKIDLRVSVNSLFYGKLRQLDLGVRSMVLESLLNLSGILNVIKGFLPKVKPKLIEADAAIPLFHPNTKVCSGRFIVANTGPQRCNITDIKLNNMINLPKVNLVSIVSRPRYGMVGEHDRKLPIPIDGHSRTQVFFITEDIPRPFEGTQPDSVMLKVIFDGRRILSQKLFQKGNAHHQYTTKTDD